MTSIAGGPATDMFLVLAISKFIFQHAPSKIVFNIFDRFTCWEETVERFLRTDDREYVDACIEHAYHCLDFGGIKDQELIPHEESWEEQLANLVSPFHPFL